MVGERRCGWVHGTGQVSSFFTDYLENIFSLDHSKVVLYFKTVVCQLSTNMSLAFYKKEVYFMKVGKAKINDFCHFLWPDKE